MTHTKPLLPLLLLMAGLACNKAWAQTARDTVFTFYFATNGHTATPKQQKDFETFLQKVQHIKSIQGYTDTTGTWAHNEKLSLWRALDIYNRLPKDRQPGVEVVANSETGTGAHLWQNRRATVMATIATEETPVSALPAADSLADRGRITELNIEQLLFIPDQPELTEASQQYVQTLARQLLQYKDAQFEIIGHVNYQSSLPPERLTNLYELSEKRAKAVYDLLVQYGIEAGRMRHKGVGNAQPVIANPVNEQEKRKNMRVQVLIIRQ